MEPIKFVDISRFHLPLRKQLHEAAIRVIDGGAYIKGPEVKIFESNMAQWMGVESICGTACGTSALWAAMKGLGVKPGGEVITTVHTAIATAEAVTLCGATPVFCDLEPGYFFLSAREAEKKIPPKLKPWCPSTSMDNRPPWMNSWSWDANTESPSLRTALRLKAPATRANTSVPNPMRPLSASSLPKI